MNRLPNTLPINLICLTILCFVGFGCTSSPKKKETIGLTDEFALDQDASDVDDEATQEIANVQDSSSLPLPIQISNGGQGFHKVPKHAYQHRYSSVSLKSGGCVFSIRTGNIIVDRYLYTNKWVKYQMGLPSRKPVVMNEGMHGSFRASMDLMPQFSKAMLKKCKSRFYKKRVYVGKFNLNRTKVSLIKAFDAPKIIFNKSSINPKSTRVYLTWPAGSKYPQLQDEFDIPVSLYTKIFRARFGAKGSYYLKVVPSMLISGLATKLSVIKQPRGPRVAH